MYYIAINNKLTPVTARHCVAPRYRQPDVVRTSYMRRARATARTGIPERPLMH